MKKECLVANEVKLEKQARLTSNLMIVSDFIEFVDRNGVVGCPPDLVGPTLVTIIINRFMLHN